MHHLWDWIPLSLSNNAEMVFAGVVAGAFVLCLVLLYLLRFSEMFSGSFQVRKLALLFSLWVVATAMWSGFFHTIRIPGAFDLTVERALFIVLMLSVGYSVFQRRVSFDMSRGIEITLFSFLALCFISMSIHGFTPILPEFSKPWFMFLVGYLMPSLAFFLVKYFLEPEKDYPVVFLALFLMGSYLCFVAFFENYGLDSLVFPAYIADDEIGIHFDRARGPFLNAAFNGQLLCIAFVCGLAIYPLLRPSHKFAASFLLMLYAPAIWFTRTRAVYLEFIMVIFGLLFCYRSSLPKWKLFSLFGVLALFVLAVNLDKLASENREAGGVAQMEEVDIRFDLVNQSLELIGQHPAFGVGLGQFRTVSLFAPSQQEYQHNHLIGVAAELGLVGLAVYLTFIVLVFRRLLRLVESMPDYGYIDSNLLLLLGLAMLVTLISNTFVEPSLHTFANLTLFIFAGMVDRLYNREILNRPS